MKRNTENLKEDLSRIFGDKYGLEKVEYSGRDNKVIMICKKHGEFEALPGNLLKGKGCPYCAGKYKNTERFIEEAREIHGDKYIYDKVKYNKAREQVIITCPIHGDFLQTPNHHLNGNGCPKCAGKFKSNEEYIEELKRVYGDKYDYSKVQYINAKTPISLYCKEKDAFGEEHGWFEITPDELKHGTNCKKCSGILIQTNDDFIKYSKLVHGDYYDYSKSDIKKRDKNGKVCIICPKHGEFWQLPHGHLSGKGCSKCNESHLERDIRMLLEEKNIKYIFNKRFCEESKLRLDFYLPDYNIAIECQGIQHFKPVNFFHCGDYFNTQIDNDKIKKELCEKHGIKLLYYTDEKFKKYDIFNSFTDKMKLYEEINKF